MSDHFIDANRDDDLVMIRRDLFAETFIVPECVGKYRLRAVGGPVKVMQAYVRT